MVPVYPLSHGSEGPLDGGRGASSLPTDAPCCWVLVATANPSLEPCLGPAGVSLSEEPLQEPLAGAALPGVCGSLKCSQQLLLCPWLSSDLFSTTVSCFPMSPPDPSPAMSRSPRRAALERVGGFCLLELLRVA